MSMIKQHLHKLEDGYPIELTLSLEDVQLILSYLEETDNPRDNELADDIRDQTYAQIQSLSPSGFTD